MLNFGIIYEKGDMAIGSWGIEMNKRLIKAFVLTMGMSAALSLTAYADDSCT